MTSLLVGSGLTRGTARARSGALAVTVAAVVAACDAPSTVSLEVTGLDGSFEVELTSGSDVRRVRIEGSGRHDLSISGENVDLAIVDQPDVPAQRCEPSALSLLPGDVASVACTEVDVCGGILSAFAEPARVEPAFPDLDDQGLSFMEAPGGRCGPSRRSARG